MKKIIQLTAVLAFTFALVACGSSGGGPDSSKVSVTSENNATDLKIIATNWAFDQTEYKVKKGEPVNFIFENEKGYHEALIRGLGINLKEGQDQQYTIHEAGTYDIICSIQCGPGHKDMVAKLIVEE